MSDKKNISKKVAEKTTAPKENVSFVFNKDNYMIMIVGVVVLIIGFFLMAGKDEIFSTTKLTIAPIVVVIGFAIEFFAIMRKAKD